MSTLVLIATDDIDFYLLLSHILEVDGFVVKLADRIDEALNVATEHKPQAIVLDCRPDSFSAPDLCAQLKQDPQTNPIAVVAVIGKGADKEHVALLKSGVDESFTRPISPGKLLEFIRATFTQRQPILTGWQTDMVTGRLSYADIEVSLDAYSVCRKGHEVRLSPIEFRILCHLMRSPGKVFSRNELIDTAWPGNIHVEERTVDVHIGRLRKALNSIAGTDVIRTVRSAGYALAPHPQLAREEDMGLASGKIDS